MARLSLFLLGPLQVMLEGKPVTDFKSSKVRALLAYLAVEADRPHSRELLATLLWPDWPDREALSNLRYALSDLRRVIGDRTADPPFLLITRDTLQFNAASDCSLDVAAFTDLTLSPSTLAESSPDPSDVEEAIALYRGAFLEGFSLGDSAPFEEWARFRREQLAQQMSAALSCLAATFEGRGEYGPAQAYARRQVELEPWLEEAHQRLMRLLALNGQRSAALAQYHTCCRLLAEELGVQPGEATTRLYEQIRDGTLKAPGARAHPPASAAEPPPFLDEELVEVEEPVFVARERELARLEGYLSAALAGQGRIVFITGEAGSGKTALAQEFTRRAQEARPDLIVAGGICNAHTGLGDPYLPFREVLQLLTGDVQARRAAGAITKDHARLLWSTLPLAAQTLVEAGPDLIDTFVSGRALAERAAACLPGGADWLTRLDELVERRGFWSAQDAGPISGAPSSRQSFLFEQYTRVLQRLARRAPLVLVVDDLQWADLGSISLLFHLGHHLAGSRVLIIGAYRPEEVAIGREGERHPLAPVVSEFQRRFGDVLLDVDQAESQDFVEAFVDSEPNRLGVAFREMLRRQTRGHPLFTIELLRGLQERGDLVQDPEGRWIEGPALEWGTLPARVEAVIAERIDRLAQPLRAALRVASVEGGVFTAEVVARVRATDEREMLGYLSGELDRRHRLIQAHSILRADGQLLSCYRFRHTLFQRYLYHSLDEVERVHLHEEVGTALEELYGSQEEIAAVAAMAVQLARHFQEARIAHKAIHYLRRAGEKAVQLSAYQEAVAHLEAGLTLLMTLPDSPQRAQQELELLLALGMALGGTKGQASREVERAYVRARELCRQLGKTALLCRILGELGFVHYVRAEHRRGHELAEEALNLAERTGDPIFVALAHWGAGVLLFSRGEYATALAHLEQVIAFYTPEQHHRTLVSVRGSDAGTGALAYAACCLWCLGYPDQALSRSQEALALARGLDHPFSLADVLSFAGCMLDQLRRDGQALKEHAEELIRLAKGRVPGWSGTGELYRAEALALLGQVDEGVAQIRESIAASQSMGVELFLSGTLRSLAQAQAKAGQLDPALATLAQALAQIEKTDERHWEAELHRLRGELLFAQGDSVGGEASLQQAIEVARRQNAKSWELRAAVSLSRLWERQGRREHARHLLDEVYGWFTEGFDTADLREARALLDQLSS
jgi:predicted ATPase/DNA-binding SARP family transcriptional activator/predicted negative regulator of RcsB-dependent stress response